jgi:hypothetical protein
LVLKIIVNVKDDNMEWIVKIEETPDSEEEKQQRIRIVFNPILEIINLFGEVKLKNNKWVIFSEDAHSIEIELEKLQEKMEAVVVTMRRRLIAYENLDKGFTVLKWVAFEE